VKSHGGPEGLAPSPEREPLALRVTDLKQYAYCKRIVFYQYVLPVERRSTYKMERGKIAQEEIQRLESRRKLKRYGLEAGVRKFDLWLHSEILGLSGKLDMLIETGSECFPVDFKWTRGGVHRNHLFQLGGYSLLVEEWFGKPVNTGFVYLLIQGDAVPYTITAELKEACKATLREIRSMIREERFPDPPRERAKCVECEYQNYCRDIW
jgi:CRISPR-associated exonuclease Cas4